jgi:hypothetical protein
MKIAITAPTEEAPSMPTVTTLVAKVDLHGAPAAALEADIRAVIARHGAQLVPCSWSPDPDTIADCVPADRVHVVDLNP